MEANNCSCCLFLSFVSLSSSLLCNFHPNDSTHLRELELAHTFGQQEEFQPDILIGSGYYWDIITGETIRGRCGPIAIRAVHMKLVVIRFSMRIQSESN